MHTLMRRCVAPPWGYAMFAPPLNLILSVTAASKFFVFCFVSSFLSIYDYLCIFAKRTLCGKYVAPQDIFRNNDIRKVCGIFSCLVLSREMER